MSFESVSSLPEAEADPDPGAEQEVFAATKGPGTEEIPSETEPPDVPQIELDTHQELLGMDPPVDMVDFVGAESTEDLKALSSEEEEVGAAQEPESLLPPSVLDQASVIAERFVSSFSRCSSLSLEDGNGKSSGFGTPRLVSRSSSVLSLEGSEKGLARWGSTTDSLGSQCAPEVGINTGMATDSGLAATGTETPKCRLPGGA